MSNVQYITDANGQRTAVILPIEQYEEILSNLHRIVGEEEDSELVEAMEESENSPTVSREEIFKTLERQP